MLHLSRRFRLSKTAMSEENFVPSKKRPNHEQLQEKTSDSKLCCYIIANHANNSTSIAANIAVQIGLDEQDII